MLAVCCHLLYSTLNPVAPLFHIVYQTIRLFAHALILSLAHVGPLAVHRKSASMRKPFVLCLETGRATMLLNTDKAVESLSLRGNAKVLIGIIHGEQDSRQMGVVDCSLLHSIVSVGRVMLGIERSCNSKARKQTHRRMCIVPHHKFVLVCHVLFSCLLTWQERVIDLE